MLAQYGPNLCSIWHQTEHLVGSQRLWNLRSKRHLMCRATCARVCVNKKDNAQFLPLKGSQFSEGGSEVVL